MKNFEHLLNMVNQYDEETLWGQSTFVNKPKNSTNIDKNLERLIAQLYFLHCGDIENIELSEEIEKQCKTIVESGILALSNEELNRAENLFLKYAPNIKEATIHLVSHAHIDMNWLWGYNETVDITIDTIKTMLNIMDQYPDFTYSHSQGCTYKILEEYAPELIEKIKQKIKVGQFEVAATTWTEKDTNMTSTESYIQHMKITRAYLKNLLALNDDDFCVDFEPDTFGHSAEVPKLLALGNVKYYYHCRGLGGDNTIHRFTSSAGHEVLAFRDPRWYNNSINPTCFSHVQAELKRFEIKDYLYVYGVGDHGGGPTMRDIEEIRRMQEWPLIPTLKMSSYRNFFESIEQYRERFPITQHELNFTLTGCFTSSSRMKISNKISENVANMTTFSDALSVYSNDFKKSNYDNLWTKTLFNQFHDILPGCGIMQTREFAAGEFQKVLAGFNQKRKNNYQSIANCVDTTFLGEAKDVTKSAFGAGVGIHPSYTFKEPFYGISVSHYISQNCIDGSDMRYYVAYNPSASKITRILDLMIWDFDVNIDKLKCFDSDGNEINFVVVERNYDQYWGHFFISLKVELSIDALSYKTIGFKEVETQKIINNMTTDGRLNAYREYKLENENVSITLDPESCMITSYLIDGVEYTNNAGFYVLNEEGSTSSAWGYGRSINKLPQKDAFKVRFKRNELYQSVKFSIKFDDTTLQITYTLPKNSNLLTVEVSTPWNYIGNQKTVPTLVYKLDCNEIDNYMNDIAGGFVTRNVKNEDVPGLSFLKLGTENEKNLFISSEEKYGYRIIGNSLMHKLIRSTKAPDTHPENHLHLFRFHIGVGDLEECISESNNVRTYVEFINAKANQQGSLPASFSLPILKAGFNIVTVGAIDEDNIFIRYMALDNFVYTLEENETLVDIYNDEKMEKDIDLKKLDIITIKKNIK